jgi:two-component system response regulator AtoC
VAFDWPGNVRQLENVLHRAAILADGGHIHVSDLPPEVARVGGVSSAASEGGSGEGTLRERLRRFEVSLIRRAIDDASGDRRAAAQRLGIGLSSLYRKLEEASGEVRAEG